MLDPLVHGQDRDVAGPRQAALAQDRLEAAQHRDRTVAGWITNLSAPDPYYISPIVMGLTMFVQQRMTPATMDPAQAKIMMFMPVMFTFMSLSFPSGLVIYWTVSNIWGIGQQYFTNYLIGRPAKPAAAK